MTRYRIQHRTVYRYARPVTLGRHRIVLRPREGHDLRVERMELFITPAHRLEWTWDVFGNCVAIVDFHEATDQLEIVSTVEVQRNASLHAPDAPEPWRIDYPVEYGTLERTMAAAYQAPSYPDDIDAVRLWLDQAFIERTHNDAERLFFDLGALIYRQMKYRRRPEKGVQTPAQTLELRSGSCRDVATLMMEAARVLGVAARFASGYLDCAAAEAGYASTHAWAEIYLPTLGWRGFDPSVGRPTGLEHVVVGVSNHPRGVMPISGQFTGNSSDYLGMDATVGITRLAT